jgi:ABC-type histidine transport system ATPase subunit
MIEIRDLHKRLGTLDVLQGVNLDIKSGESIVIIGPAARASS